MSKSRTITKRLQSALDEGVLVQLYRERFDNSEPTLGYVVAIGSTCFLLSIVDPIIRFNGFSVLRTKDVTKLEAPHQHAAFVERALTLRGEVRPSAPCIDMSSWSEIVRTAAIHGGLITIHREAVDRSVCQVGRPVTVDDSLITMTEIDCDAKWEAGWTRYRLSELTRLDFGGGYEQALLIVNRAK